MEGKERDLVIAGAGPGGLAAANEAARLGLDVLLLERQYEIGYPIRTTGGSFIKDAERLGIPERHYHKIKNVVFASRTKSVEFAYRNYNMCVMDVKAVYQHFAEQAMKNGATLELGTEVKTLIMEGNFVRGVTAKRRGRELRVDSKIVIDATGFPATLARQFGSYPKSSSRFAAGAEYEAFVDNLDNETITIIYDKSIVPSGYAWIFPVAKDRARLGLGAIKPDSNLSPFELLDAFVFGRKNRFIENLGKVYPLEMHAGNIPVEPVPSVLTGNGFMTIGDAAVQTTPVGGEGIRLAMDAGIAAANSAADATGRGDFSKRSFSAYEEGVKRVLEYNRLGLKIQKRLISLSDEERDSLVENLVSKLTDLPVDDVMALFKGEFSKRLILGIAAKKPGAVARAAMGLMTKS